jgi:hypothetical protein
MNMLQLQHLGFFLKHVCDVELVIFQPRLGIDLIGQMPYG